MKFSLKFSFAAVVLVFTLACSSTSGIQQIETRGLAEGVHVWFPPSDEELEQRRMSQKNLDIIAVEIEKLYIRQENLDLHAGLLESPINQMAQRVETFEPALEQSALQEQKKRKDLKKDLMVLAKMKTDIQTQAEKLAAMKQPKKLKAKNKANNYISAINQFKNRNYLESIRLFKASLKQSPPAHLLDNIYFGIGVSRFKLNDHERATRSLSWVVENYSNGDKWFMAQVMLGLIHHRNGESSRALYILTRARKNTQSDSIHRLIDRILEDIQKETLYAAR